MNGDKVPLQISCSSKDKLFAVLFAETAVIVVVVGVVVLFLQGDC